MLLAAVADEASLAGLWPAGEGAEGLLGHRLEVVAERVEAALGRLLGPGTAGLGVRPYDLAVAWQARRGDGRAQAELLWAAARRSEPVYRKLEERFVAELEWAAAAAWMARRVYDDPERAAMRARKPAGTDSWRRGSSSGRTRSSGAISHGGSGTSSSS
jgi:hypothetical protein